MKTLPKALLLIIFATIALVGCSGETPNISFLNSPTPTASNTPTPTNTVTPSPTATATLTPTPTLTPTSTQIGGGSGKVIFGYAREGFESKFPDLEGDRNIFIADLDSGNLTPITNGLRGYNSIEALSPDGNKVLISSFTSWNRKNDARGILYLYDLNNINAEPIEIVQGFSQHTYSTAAAWTDDLRIIYIGKGEKGYGIYVANADGSDPQKIDTTTATPERIVGIDSRRVYWSTGVYREYANEHGSRKGDFYVIWWTNIDGSGQGKLESNGVQVEYFIGKMALSPDGNMIAWFPTDPDILEPNCDMIFGYESIYAELGLWESNDLVEAASKCTLLYVAKLDDIDNPIKIPPIPPRDPKIEHFLYNNISKIAWSPDSSKIFLFDRGGRTHTEHYIDTEEDIEDYPPALYYVEPENASLQLVYLEGIMSLYNEDPRFTIVPSFSPDGRRVTATRKEGDSRTIALVDLETIKLSNEFLINFDRYVLKESSIYWLP